MTFRLDRVGASHTNYGIFSLCVCDRYYLDYLSWRVCISATTRLTFWYVIRFDLNIYLDNAFVLYYSHGCFQLALWAERGGIAYIVRYLLWCLVLALSLEIVGCEYFVDRV